MGKAERVQNTNGLSSGEHSGSWASCVFLPPFQTVWEMVLVKLCHIPKLDNMIQIHHYFHNILSGNHFWALIRDVTAEN